MALGAVQHLSPEWLEDEDLVKDFVGHLKKREADLPGELREHFDKFTKWSPFGKYHEAFMKLSAGIHVN